MAGGWGDGHAWNLPKHSNQAFFKQYLRFDGCKIAQVRGQIEVHFHLRTSIQGI